MFRDQLSTAATVFRDGDWLRLVDGSNRVVGHGIYAEAGAIAIRVLRAGTAAPDARWLHARVLAALTRRERLLAETDGIRLLHGENDGVPAVVADRFGDAIVVASYAAGADAMARYVARVLPSLAHPVVGPATAIVVRGGRRRQGAAVAPRAMRGVMPPLVTFREGALTFAVDLEEGHKTGTYLDLRGLRRAIAAMPLTGARVLNLFSYTGMLGRAAEAAGAASIVHVDASERALAFARVHHAADPARHRYECSDVFAWLPTLAAHAAFELVIVDPPSMTSDVERVPAVLAGYRKLYAAAAPHVAPGGLLVSACCTSRVPRKRFFDTVAEVLGDRFTRERELAVEPDHPVTFPQGDYLKIALWRARP